VLAEAEDGAAVGVMAPMVSDSEETEYFVGLGRKTRTEDRRRDGRVSIPLTGACRPGSQIADTVSVGTNGS
jgi:hypothetical protein